MKALKLFAELTLGRVIILALFLTAGYYVSYFDAGESIEKQISDANAEIATEEARKNGITITMRKEEEMRGNVQQLQRNLEVVKSKIPADLREVDMQSVINAAAASSGVSIKLLNVIPSDRDRSAPPKQVSIAEIKPENLIDEVKFRVSINATFSSFLDFLDYLAKENKVIKLRNFKIVRASLTNVEEDHIDFDGEIVGFKQANIQIIQGTK